MTKAGEGREKETDTYRQRENAISNCQSRFIDARHDSATRAFQQKVMSDPAAMSAQTKAMTELGARYAKLVRAGDTAGARRLMGEKMRAIYQTPKADAAAAIKKCGALRHARPISHITPMERHSSGTTGRSRSSD